jgi:hypothetical protein
MVVLRSHVIRSFFDTCRPFCSAVLCLYILDGTGAVKCPVRLVLMQIDWWDAVIASLYDVQKTG